MIRLLLPLLVILAVSAPAAAQPSRASLQSLLVDWGFPNEALAVFYGSEADARRILGAPTAESVQPNDLWGGPEFRELEYGLSGGSRLVLSVCTDHERRARGIRRPQVFCEMRLIASRADDRVPDADVALLREIADRTFGQCDTQYYVLEGLTVSLPWYHTTDGWHQLIVLEASPREGERIASP